MSSERIALLDVERAASASALDADADEGASTRDRQHPSTSRRVVLATLTTCALLAAGSAATRGRLDWSDTNSSVSIFGYVGGENRGVTNVGDVRQSEARSSRANGDEEALGTFGRLGEIDYGSLAPEELRALVTKELADKVEGHGLPVFLHIPKAGGTTIENELGRLGIEVGLCHARPYEKESRFNEFEPWHTPPVGQVPNSWVIVRNPYTRAQSEFLWASNWEAPEVFQSLNPGYSAQNCRAFASWVEKKMKPAYENTLRECYSRRSYTSYGIQECNAQIAGGLGVSSHWIPQSIMAASATTVFRMEDCMSVHEGVCAHARGDGSQPNILSFMRTYYHPAVSLRSVSNEWHDSVQKPDLGACWDQFDPQLLDIFNRVYDFDFSQFRYPVKTPAQRQGDAFDDDRRGSNLTLSQVQAMLPEGEVVQDNAGPQC